MLGARATCALSLCVLLCSLTVGCASRTARRSAGDLGAREGDATLVVELGSETAAPIAGARLLVDGRAQDRSLTDGPVRLALTPGLHRVTLDLLLLRGGPRVYGRGPAYEARLRGSTEIEIAQGCRVVLQASTHEVALFDVRPELRFRQELSCLGADGPIPPPRPSEPIPSQITRGDFLEWSDIARQSCRRSEELVALAASVAERNEDIEQARCLEDRRAAIASRRGQVDALLEASDVDEEDHLRRVASSVRALVEEIRWLQERARQCL